MLNFGNKEFRNLQEQVLENAKNIEILKERPGLKPVVVSELPAVGEEGILYLVPKNPDPDTSDADSYDEYIWLPETQTYEFVGSTALNLSNMVTTDTPQTITGAKTFSAITNFNSGLNASEITLGPRMSIKNHDSASNNYIDLIQSDYRRFTIGDIIYSYVDFLPGANGLRNLGSPSMRWNNVYLYGNAAIDFGVNATITKDGSNRINLNNNGTPIIKVGAANATYCAANWTPDKNNFYNLGGAEFIWKTTYTDSLSNGSTELPISNISTKTTSTFISGTFDTDGKSIIDISGGTPEGLFIFTYGNCQCFLRLTATMVQNADTAPIRVSCPMIFNSNAVFGWLEISRSGTTLTIRIVNDAYEHVDSGYSWTLTKTNLL